MEQLRPDDPRRIGDYQVLGRLGSGAMGQVYLGRSMAGRAVAIKMVHHELAEDEEFRQRFRREVALARRVSGFWTAPVVAADPDAPQPWLATAYVRGPSLAQAIAVAGALPEVSVRVIAAGLAEALEAIHSAGLVHRDVKPSNVMIASDGPRLIDFGISRAVEGTALTKSGFTVGTPGFMSPEQVEGLNIGPASDTFSLGAVLVFAATGAGPFGIGSPPALLYRVVHSDVELTAVPTELRTLVGRCLTKKPEDRPTPREVLDLAGTVPDTSDGKWLPEILSTFMDRSNIPEATLQYNGLGNLPRSPSEPRMVAAEPSLLRADDKPKTRKYTVETAIPTAIPSHQTMGRSRQPYKDERKRERPSLTSLSAALSASGLTLFAAVTAWRAITNPENNTGWLWYFFLSLAVLTELAIFYPYRRALAIKKMKERNELSRKERMSARKTIDLDAVGTNVAFAMLFVAIPVIGFVLGWRLIFESGSRVPWYWCALFTVGLILVTDIRSYVLRKASLALKLSIGVVWELVFIVTAGYFLAGYSDLQWYQDMAFLIILWLMAGWVGEVLTFSRHLRRYDEAASFSN